MKISYDKKADAFSLVFAEGRVSRDGPIAENVFAGYSKDGELLEIQILEVSKLERPWLTLEAAAKYLQKSERTILRWIKSGKIRPIKIGKQYHILPDDLKKLAI
ncbi:MAG: helix-turn-helix domain-containing protein [Pseudomonadota bacterium]